MFSSFPASEDILANSTPSNLPFASDSTVFIQSDKTSANLPLTPTPALSLATSASAAAELTSQGDFFSSSFSTYLGQDASFSIGESLTFLRTVS